MPAGLRREETLAMTILGGFSLRPSDPASPGCPDLTLSQPRSLYADSIVHLQG